MTAYNLQDYINTCSTWNSLLNELRVVNINMKLQLTESISQASDTRIIDKAEIFQHNFVEKDQIIDLLRHDINNLLQQIKATRDTNSMIQYMKTLDEDISKLQKEFVQLQKKFDRFRSITSAT
jgi:hypothetical protein